MALHPVQYPAEAEILLEYVRHIERLFERLAVPRLMASDVNESWIVDTWPNQDANWIHKFCKSKPRKDSQTQLQRIKVIAGASSVARAKLAHSFREQNNVEKVFKQGGHYIDIKTLDGFDDALASNVRIFLEQCYEFLGADGFISSDGITLTKRSYKEAYASHCKTSSVCPYCDGDNSLPELDHYYAKSKWPLLAISPFNLIPVCTGCNSFAGGKGNRPALSLDAVNPTEFWLHPYYCPASPSVEIRLSGKPVDSVPQLWAADQNEQRKLDNHTNLIPNLGLRWTRQASRYFGNFVKLARKKLERGKSVDDYATECLDDFIEMRGYEPASLIGAAVCQAVLEGREGYRDELSDSNPLGLD